MKVNINPDPIGEYYRICPYCGFEFTANHMNRKFCAEKSGKKDYCKIRYRRSIGKFKEACPVDAYNPNVIINSYKLQKLLKGNSKLMVEENILQNIKFDFSSYTAESNKHSTNFYSVFVENFHVETFTQGESQKFYKIENMNFV